jgi:hypothetical protein
MGRLPSLSTNTQTMFMLFWSRGIFLKSIDMCCYRQSGIGNGYSNPRALSLGTFERRQA